MNLLSHLNSFEKKVNTLRFSQKIQLYLIPILMAFFIVYNFSDLTGQTLVKSAIPLQKNDIDSYEFLTKLENFAKRNGLNILNIKQNNLVFTLEVEGDFLELMPFILFCETYESINTIDSFKLSLKEHSNNLMIQFSFAQHKYEAKQKDVEHIAVLQNPFMSNVLSSKEELKLYAIVNQDALINEMWLRKGDIYLEYEVMEVKRHKVIVKNKAEQRIALRLIKE